MSDEMVMRTTDSPAVATEGSSSSIYLQSDNSSYAENAPDDMALNSQESNTSDDDLSWIEEYLGNSSDTDSVSPDNEIRQRLFDALGNQTDVPSVPYERFREVNEQAKASKDAAENYGKWSEVIDRLKEQGYQSAEDVNRALREQAVQQQEQEIRSRYEQHANEIGIDPALARTQAEVEIQKQRYDSLVSTMSDYMRTNQREQAMSQFPYARRGEMVVDNLIKSGVDPVSAAEIVHNQIVNLTESLVPEITAMIAQQRSVPTPLDTSLSAQPVIPQPNPQKQNGFGRITSLLGIGRNPNSL
jgi:hypothetical protein